MRLIVVGCQRCGKEKETTELEQIGNFKFCSDCAPIVKANPEKYQKAGEMP